MNDQFQQQTKGFIAKVSRDIHHFVAENISDEWVVQVFVKFFILLGIMLLSDLIFKLILIPLFRSYRDEQKYPLFKAIYSSEIVKSIANILALMIGGFALKIIFQPHPDTREILKKFMEIAVVITLAKMAMRSLAATKHYYTFRQDYYRVVALNAIAQTLRTIGIFIFGMITISILFGIKGSTIIGSLGAITAVLVLVFRDTILGFMTGIHVATSKSLKVGDWIGIPKYNLEGTILEINLITTKIQNFDKTISTIPTYDLLSTEVKNHQIMAEGNLRRIKKSITFNVNSFKFLDEKSFQKFKKINLIKDYLDSKEEEVFAHRYQFSNSEMIINGRQLTNIGIFRRYTEEYLKNNPKVDHNEVIMVRQLDITPQGMPLELYCFATQSEMLNYEKIQSDIFDHLLVASKEFDLEIMQFYSPVSK